MQDTRDMFRVGLRGTALAVAWLLISACSGGGDYTRGVFHGHVLGKTQDEIVSRFGQPIEIDNSIPDQPVLVYKNKTFDPENMNKVDEFSRVHIRKTSDGRFVADDTSFVGASS